MDRMPTPVKHRNDEEDMEITASATPPGSEKPSRKSQLFENSLKPLLTPDKWTNLTIFLKYAEYGKQYASICRNARPKTNMQNSDMFIFCILVIYMHPRLC